MSWSIHLSREKGPFIDAIVERRESIPLADWLEIVEADPELKLVLQEQKQQKLLSDGTMSSGKLVAVGWIAHPDEEWIVFEWQNGLVESGRPDRAICSKLLELARKLHGTLQHDDGQICDSVEQMTLRSRPVS